MGCQIKQYQSHIHQTHFQPCGVPSKFDQTVHPYEWNNSRTDGCSLMKSDTWEFYKNCQTISIFIRSGVFNDDFTWRPTYFTIVKCLSDRKYIEQTQWRKRKHILCSTHFPHQFYSFHDNSIEGMLWVSLRTFIFNSQAWVPELNCDKEKSIINFRLH